MRFHNAILLAAMVVLAAAVGAQANPGPKFRPERLAKALELTQDQQQAMDAARYEAEKARIETKARMAVARLELKRLLAADRYDEAAVNKQVDELAQLRAALQKARLARRQAFLGALTAEQQAKLKELRATRGMRGRASRGLRPRMGVDRHRSGHLGSPGMFRGLDRPWRMPHVRGGSWY